MSVHFGLGHGPLMQIATQAVLAGGSSFDGAIVTEATQGALHVHSM
jgi:hypothetical protein